MAVLGVIICCICGADLSALLSGYLESFLHAKPGHADVISFHAFLFTPECVQLSVTVSVVFPEQ